MNIFIPWKPLPLQRARGRSVGRRIMFYDSQAKEKQAFADLVKSELRRSVFPVYNADEILCVSLTFTLPCPKSRKPGRHGSRPDLSNLIKFVEDALNGVLWKDDAQIAYLQSSKWYSDQEGVRIHVWIDEP